LLGRWATVSTVEDGASRLPAAIATEIVALLD
jgi:dTMP kinase